MNPQFPNSMNQNAPDAETTLRLIATLPAPAGLEDRVHAALQSAPEQARGVGRVLAWTEQTGHGPRGAANGWMRSAAAAAIAFVVVGGGWGVYSRVQQPGRVIAIPVRVVAPGGFGGAGAIRMPQTLNGPVLSHPPVVAHSAAAKKTVKKAAAKHGVAPVVTPAAH
jgi:hypothetical protein